MMKSYKQCIFWTKTGRELPQQPDTLASHDPNHIDFVPTFFLSEAYRELGMVGQAMEEAAREVQTRPNHPQVRQHYEDMQRWAQQHDVKKGAQLLVQHAPMDLRIALGRAAPGLTEEIGVGKVEKYLPETDRPMVTFLCGPTAEDWGPRSLETGCGGSERMVIELAPRLQKLGYSVQVYAKVPRQDRGIDPQTGVLWKHFGEFNPKLKRQFLVGWRNPAVLRTPVAAEKRYCYMHDVADDSWWNRVNLELTDKIITVSKWHGTNWPSVPENKLYVSRNGIDSGLIAQLLNHPEHKRNPKRVVYCSSPDRGLLQCLRGFQAARKHDPELVLDIYYGFTPLYFKMAQGKPYFHCVTQGRIRHMLEYMEDVYDTVQSTPGVNWRGRISCDQLVEELTNAGVWLYPAPFTETSCMSAMEAQAAGCAVVASDVAALKETVLWDCPTNMLASPDDNPEDVGKLVLEATTFSEEMRRETAQVALKAFDLGELAKEWAKDLFNVTGHNS
jgi:glycosyltransferase involved in cell wall biosynthesis